MLGITHPINFQDIKTMNQFYSDFETKAIEICERYNVPELWTRVRIHKDDKSLELSIISLGSYLKGSDDEKAAKEIINTFNNL